MSQSELVQDRGRSGGCELNRRICIDAVAIETEEVLSLFPTTTVVLHASAATVAQQRLQFIFQRDREFSNSAPDLSGVYGGEP
jgi:hypothetical protein